MRAAAVIACVLGLVGAAPARAQVTYAPFKMVQDAYPIYVDGRSDPVVGIPLSNVISDVQAAINGWNATPGSYARWTYSGRAVAGNPAGMATPEDSNDTFSVAVLFVTQRTDPYYDLALGGGEQKSGSIPLTYAGQLYACDIFLNAVNFAWTAGTLPLTSTTASVQSFVGHELGRCMGLTTGAGDMNAVMWFDIPLGDRRSPIQADFDLLAPRYPNDGTATGSPCDGQLGAPTTCAGTLKCATPAGTDPWGRTWRKMCTQPCAPGTAGACPVPYACVASTLFAPTYSYACLPNTGTDITQVGKPCTANPDCGSAVGLCNLQGTLPSGGGPLWSGGYCTQNCAAAGGQPCPNGSECVPAGGQYRCLKSCRVGYGDCRADYACAALAGVRDGVCISACAGDVDCNGTAPFCRTCDGLCFDQNKPTGVIGDACTTSADCGAAQVCYTAFPWAPGKGVCTQPCGTVCSACPNGSTCVAMPYSGGSLFCVRDCVPGTCPATEQCLTIGGSRGCVPSCTVASCPVGYTCSLGQCTPTNFDAGSCELCWSGVGGPGPGGG
ncbi:MAG TPA: hypothetical protein VND93_28220, partial [Myxococcales bacterium]|nr:hypothetical protein [Myxococcales bacterium]